MAFVSGRCPNCSGEVQLDESKESGFCLHCGSPIQVQEAVARLKVEHSGSVHIRGVATDESSVQRGFMEIKNKNGTAALDAFESALNINPKNYQAWKGIFLAVVVENRAIYEKERAYSQHDWNLFGVFLIDTKFYGVSVRKVGDHTDKGISALDTAINLASNDYKRELLDLKQQFVVVPLEKIEQTNKWLEKGMCGWCGGNRSLLGKCKSCGKNTTYSRDYFAEFSKKINKNDIL